MQIPGLGADRIGGQRDGAACGRARFFPPSLYLIIGRASYSGATAVDAGARIQRAPLSARSTLDDQTSSNANGIQPSSYGNAIK